MKRAAVLLLSLVAACESRPAIPGEGARTEGSPGATASVVMASNSAAPLVSHTSSPAPTGSARADSLVEPSGQREQEARRKTALDQARAVRAAAAQQLALANDAPCPTLTQLVEAKLLPPGGERDPWNQPFSIECTGDDVIVTSFGEDGEPGTDDDLRVPLSG